MSGHHNILRDSSAKIVLQAGAVYGGINGLGAPTEPPKQLAAVAEHFTDRRDECGELEAFRRAPEGAGRVKAVVIHGVPGVGKTTVAVKWLNEVAAEYEDGHLHIDLGGSRIAGAASPDALLAHALAELGREPAAIPADTAAKEAVFRSLTRGRSIILLLDDAATAAQVRAFLPADADALVVITCTGRLPLHAVRGAKTLRLGPMGHDAVEEFLRKALPPDMAADPREDAGIRSLAERCRGLPLLAHMAVTALANDPFSSPGGIADAFEQVGAGDDDETEGPEMGERSFPAEVQAFVDRLPEESARAYRLLGLHPVGVFDHRAVAALLGADLRAAQAALVDLDKNGLIHRVGDRAEKRFGMDEAVRAHARSAAAHAFGARETEEARRRCAYYYTAAVLEAAELVTRRWSLADRRRARTMAEAEGAPAPPPLSNGDDARTWMRANLEAVLAVARDRADASDHDPVWMITEGVDGYLRERGRHTDRQALMVLGVGSAEAVGNTAAEARIRNQYGLALLDEGHVAEAGEQFSRALALSEHDDDGRGQGAAWECLGIAAQHDGDHTEALRCFDRAEPLKRAMNRPQAMAVLAMLRGRSLAALGRSEEALHALAAALEVFEEEADEGPADPVNAAKTRLERGRALAGLAQVDDALRELRAALAAFEERGHVLQQARAHEELAQVLRARPSDRWTDHLRAAAVLYRGIGDEHAAARIEAQLPPEEHGNGGSGPEE
ncbi:NB-ARC domain-containing protein [Nocardiopsis chromatogenes]|uniref:NB-ARC domain-containing protein n=1 Tax=Nocardiopsis chromatogenes TaxID=280239 RepID=UPI00034C71F2|nr:NB-ARC domain-containing protein [Nocardiopsis chromatogenes]